MACSLSSLFFFSLDKTRNLLYGAAGLNQVVREFFEDVLVVFLAVFALPLYLFRYLLNVGLEAFGEILDGLLAVPVLAGHFAPDERDLVLNLSQELGLRLASGRVLIVQRVGELRVHLEKLLELALEVLFLQLLLLSLANLPLRSPGAFSPGSPSRSSAVCSPAPRTPQTGPPTAPPAAHTAPDARSCPFLKNPTSSSKACQISSLSFQSSFNITYYYSYHLKILMYFQCRLFNALA